MGAEWVAECEGRGGGESGFGGVGEGVGGDGEGGGEGDGEVCVGAEGEKFDADRAVGLVLDGI